MTHELCDHRCQGFGLCKLEAGHKGRHTTEVFVCEGCSKARRGRPAAIFNEPDGTPLRFCFLCAPSNRYNLSPDLRRKMEDYY